MMLNRRDFLSQTAVAGAGIAIGARAFAHDTGTFGFAMQSLAAGSHLTPVLLVDDSVRLLLVDRTIDDDFKKALITYRRFALSSGALELDRAAVAGLLSEIRDGWATRDGMEVPKHSVTGDMLEPKLAATAGWMAQAAGKTAIYGDTTPARTDEQSLYHDMTLVHAVQDSDWRVRRSAGASTAAVKELANLLDLAYYRAYMRMHTIDPDFDDVEAWILKVVSLNREIKKTNLAYAEVYLDPDPAKVDRWIESPGFYNESDPIIDLTRSLQHGRTQLEIDLDEALGVATGQSQYARGLAASYAALRDAQASVYTAGVGHRELD